jgi:formate dehydrogenase maturation protein FdhE
MKIRCKVCGEFFSPDEETVELVSDGYIDSVAIDTCDECWDMLNHLYDDTEEMISDADPGL